MWRSAPTLRDGALSFYRGMGGCKAGCFSWAATCFNVIFGCRAQSGHCGLVDVVWCVLFRKFPELLCLQDASSNFLVLRTKAHKILGLIIHYGVQQALAKRA